MSVLVEGIVKRYAAAGTPAVQTASFAASTGAITALLGPSGSGKTTLLRVIAGLEEPDAGTVRIHGDDVTRTPPRERGIGFVFQGYALFSHMSVRDNIAFGLSIRGQTRRQIASRVDELLALVQLSELGARMPGQLSGGQRQRVAFARALATRPKVLLLDEPFGALDARVRLELRTWLRELHARTHVTTILVTHDQEEALELSDQIVLMQDGGVVQKGAPHELYDRPATPFVASFIGDASLLRAKVEAGRAVLGATSVRAPEGTPEGAEVRVYVRPHEIKLARPSATAERAALPEVERLTRVGGVVKVGLRLPNAEGVIVQLAYDEAEALDLRAGERVTIDLGDPKVFVEAAG